jgi:hypothetical protein
MTSSSKPANTPATPASSPPASAPASASAEEGTAPPATRTAAAGTQERTGNTGVAGPEFSDPAFTADDLDEMELAGSPFYQLAPKIRQALGEREIVTELGNTERVYAMDKELEEYRRAWDDRPEEARASRNTPPIGRQTPSERQIQTGGTTSTTPAPAPAKTAPPPPTTSGGTTPTNPASTQAPAKTAPTPPASAPGTATGGSEAKP